MCIHVSNPVDECWNCHKKSIANMKKRINKEKKLPLEPQLRPTLKIIEGMLTIAAQREKLAGLPFDDQIANKALYIVSAVLKSLK